MFRRYREVDQSFPSKNVHGHSRSRLEFIPRLAGLQVLGRLRSSRAQRPVGFPLQSLTQNSQYK